MSLGKTLLKVAIGVAIAKGISSMTKGAGAGTDTTSAGRGTRYDGGNRGGLEDMMGDILGGGSKGTTRTTQTNPQGGGLGDLLGDLLGGGTQKTAPTSRDSGSAGGGLGDLLEQLSGTKRSNPRASAPKGGLEDLLGQLTGTSKAGRESGSGGGVGDLLDQVLAGSKTVASKTAAGKPMILPEPEQEEELSAALLLRAVIQAVKCDGNLDEAEKKKLFDAMGDATAAEVKAVNAELSRPVDVEGLARAVPAGMEPKVYTLSLMAIDLDQQAEAEYLHALAQALELTPEEVNALHDRAGAPRIYR
ncbi:DUF533 domain-containing protein [Pseudogemmobacter blasticus]|uniref:DUF533 domain-containing protein n=1 Tax=Fuscovulum blasticum DSM 2131 TaxID=1188250 RepID=A0A2T4J463_FUSBL|nr:DUF533 domain-containing protein [Fuscovulum blasticum]PTE12647.1 DUF533 domain-containing protein [Fuscovulum blasticum DSM 2131]